MSIILQSPRQFLTSVEKNLVSYQRLIFLSGMTVLLWSVDSGIFTQTSWSQTSIDLPKTETPIPPHPAETEVSPTTFSPEQPSPENYSPPRFTPTTSQQFRVYHLNAGDGISITVPQFPEFSTITNVDEEGNILIPILGRISLVGLSTVEAEEKISYELGNRFVQEQPEVLVALTAPRPANITVLGEVVRPGFYSFVSGAPVTSVLSAAGGTSDEADLRSVIVRRTLVDGSVLEQKVDLYSPLLKGESFPDLGLQGGDTIIVSKLEVGEDRDYDRNLVARTTLPQQTINVRVLVPSTTGTAFRNLVLPNGSTFIDAITSLPPDDNLLIDEQVALLRFDPEKGGIVTQTLNTDQVIHGDIAHNIPLRNEDVIVVSRTLLGKIFNAFNVITQPIRSLFGFRAFFDTLFN